MDPWAGAPLNCFPNADLDPRRFAKREALCRKQAIELKYHHAIEAGRIYGLGNQRYEIMRRQKLEAVMKRPPVSEHW
jgi:hypothetical protein